MYPKYLTFITWKEGRYYVSQCLNVDVSSFGNTYEKAVENLKEAVDLYLEDAPKDAMIEIKEPAISVREFQHA
ncbi:type II toxin-antitoxin system HicB family antitoxin [Patescibacteria group bacterium]|nr:type II toxin-antitoxin system HicB family antitoxin [Patescibacteria group bacterium]